MGLTPSDALAHEPSSLEVLREQMAPLPAATPDVMFQRLARWAGDEPDARAVAARGTAALGFDAWLVAYGRDPDAWLKALGADALASRWGRALAKLPATLVRWLERFCLVAGSLDLTTLVGGSAATLAAVRELSRLGWLTVSREARIEVPAMRRQWFNVRVRGDATPSARTWIRTYLRTWLASGSPVTDDDRATLAVELEHDDWVAELSLPELRAAVGALRHTARCMVAVGALRRRLQSRHDAAGGGTALRRLLGCALVDIGAYDESLPLLRDRSRASRVVRAHALIRQGRGQAGRALLQRMGPGRNDVHWAHQWALAAVVVDDRQAEALLRQQLEVAHEPRRRGFVWSTYAEQAERRGSFSAALPGLVRALADFGEGGDEVSVAWCRSRYARALQRAGQREQAAHVAAMAWEEAKHLPGPTLRGSAALACVETQLAEPTSLQGALRAAMRSELPDVARDARLVLGPDPGAPVLSMGPGGVRLDGLTVPVTPGGPPWRVLEHLSHLAPGASATQEELFAAGWPGEKVRASSQRQRVHTALWTLRRAGLRTSIQTMGGNRYRLVARVITDGEA